MKGWEKEDVFEMKKGREVEAWEKEGVFEMKRGREVEGWKEGVEGNSVLTVRYFLQNTTKRLCDHVASLVLILKFFFIW